MDSLKPLVNWDLSPDNVMVGDDGRWWVLDWDGLAIGNPAEDYASLFWPFFFAGVMDRRALLDDEWDSALSTRLDLHLRAITLDHIIDPLADWVECDVEEWKQQVRDRKETEHEECFEFYRNRWS